MRVGCSLDLLFPRLLSLCRAASVYLLLVLIPQILWLHSKWKVGLATSAAETVCETCSLLPQSGLRATAHSEPCSLDGTRSNPAINVTLMYEQICQGVCGYGEDDVLEGERISEWTQLMNELEYGTEGGWSIPHDLPDLGGPCNIQRRNASLSQLEFVEKFSRTEPVILEGVSDQTLFRRASSKWRLLSDYGQELITVATANTHSYHKTKMTLCKYVGKFMKQQSLDALGNETLYHFGDNDRERWSQLFSLYQLPPYTLPGMEPVLSFGLAGPGSGVPFHIHGPTFAETFFGRKRWFLYSPEVDPKFHPNQSTLHWVTHTLPSLPPHQSPLQCTLRPGEVFCASHY